MKSQVTVIIGVLHDASEDNQSLTDLGEATDTASSNRCCGMDCCDGNGIIHWRDQLPSANQAKYIEYVKNGAKVLATEAAYLADKAAGFV